MHWWPPISVWSIELILPQVIDRWPVCPAAPASDTLIYCHYLLPSHRIFSAVLFPFEEEVVVISFTNLIFKLPALFLSFRRHFAASHFCYFSSLNKTRLFSTTRLLLPSLAGMCVCVCVSFHCERLANWPTDWLIERSVSSGGSAAAVMPVDGSIWRDVLSYWANRWWW